MQGICQSQHWNSTMEIVGDLPLMSANEKIVSLNPEQIPTKSEMLKGPLTSLNTTGESNSELIAANSKSMDDLSANVSKNKPKIDEELMENKEKINSRRQSIL